MAKRLWKTHSNRELREPLLRGEGSSDYANTPPKSLPQERVVKFTVTVSRASGLPHRSSILGRERRFIATASDGVKTMTTSAVPSNGQSVQWDKILGEFTVKESSHLTLHILAKRTLHENDLVGSVKVPFESITSSRDLDLVLEKDSDDPTPHSTLHLTFHVSALQPRTSIETSSPASAVRQPEETPVERVSALAATRNPTEAHAAVDVLLRADEVVEDMRLVSESTTASVNFLEQAPELLRGASDLYEKWEAVVSRMRGVMEAVDKIAEIHPYARMAWSILSCIPKTLLAQVERDENIRALLLAVHDAFDLTQLVGFLKVINPLSKQVEILALMLQHVCDCGDFIKSYAQDSRFWKRFFKNLPHRIDDRIEQYRTTLISLRDDLLRHASVTTEVAVFDIQDGIGNISRRFDGLAFQLEQVSGQITDIAMDGKIREIPYAAGSRFRRDKGCLPGTRIDFLDFIVDWANSPDSTRALVLLGQAGTGKSSIAHEVALRFGNMRRLSSSFIFLRDERSKRDSYLLFTTIARDLSDRYPPFRTALGKAVENDTSLRLGAKDYATLFEHLLRQPSNSGLHLVGPILIVIDGLDECGDAIGESGLHTFLADHICTLPPNFRILITSRAEKDIEQAFVGAISTRVIYIDDPTLAARTHDDIYAYFQKNLPKQVMDQYGHELAAKAEGLFQWAAAACGYIGRPPRGLTQSNCVRRLLDLGSESKRMDPLDDLYRSILESYFDLDDEDVLRRYQSVMGQLFASFEPISIRTLTALRQYTGDTDDEGSIHAVVGDLGSLLNNVSSPDSSLPITPLHTSFRDFLMDKKRSGAFHVHLDDAHRQLAPASLDLMRHDLHLNICDLYSSHALNRDVPDLESRIAEHIFAALSYACRFWDEHLERVAFNPDLFGKLRSLFETKFPFWLEVLSITGNIGLASQALSSLKTWLAGLQFNALAEIDTFHQLVDDALAFVRYFGVPIAQSAPHIYLSALPFTPSSSPIYARYAGMFPNTLSLKRGRLPRWPALETIIPTQDECYTIAYSPNGQHIASGLGDNTVCVWNTATGETVAGPFIGHTDLVSSVVFSPDGRRIASGSRDKTIILWDAMTGEIVAGPLVGHTNAISSVDFSPDGQCVVSGSGDRNIRVWNAATGETVVGPLTGHTAWVFSVRFSPDGRRIVSGSGDHSIRIWDATTGETVAEPFDGHTNYVNSVAFSQDGLRIVSGSNDQTIRIWDATTGNTVVGPLRGHTNHVGCVAFSPDGQRIVSGSNDNTIRIWSATTGLTIAGPFQDHTDRIRSVAFSPDDRHIASGSLDQSICIWDATTRKTTTPPFHGHTESITSVMYSPDGQHIVSGSADGVVYIWKASTGEVVVGPLTGHAGWVNCVAFSPNGQHVASGAEDYTIILWNAMTGEKVAGPMVGHEDEVSSIAFSPDGETIVSCSLDHTVRTWNAATGEAVSEPFTGHTEEVHSVAFSPNGRHVASGSADHTIRLWDVTTGAVVMDPFQGHSDALLSVAFSPDGRRIASGSSDRRIRIWDVTTGETVAGPLRGHADSIRSITFSPDGRYLASGSADSTIRVWNTATGECIAGPFRGHTDVIYSVAFSPNGQRIVSGSADEKICVWDAKTGQILVTELPARHTGAVKSVAFSPDGQRIVSGSVDHLIFVWSATTGEMLTGPLHGHRYWICAVVFSPDGQRIASGSCDRTICIWDATTGELVAGPFGGHTDFVNSVAFSPDGLRVVSGSDDCTIRVWDAATGRTVVGPLTGHTHAVSTVTFSPDGRSIASGSTDRTIRVWNATTGEAVAGPFHGHTKNVSCVLFSPDGKHIASSSYDRSIRVWDAVTGETVAGPFRDHLEDINSIAYSPDGRYIASASDDYTVCVWDATTGEIAAGSFYGHTGLVHAVSFSPDGRRVASGSEDGTIRVWDVGIDKSDAANDVSEEPVQEGTDAASSIEDPPEDDGGSSSGSWDTIDDSATGDSGATEDGLNEDGTADDSDVEFADQAQIEEDGWIRGDHDELLMWIPRAHRVGLYRPSNVLVIGENETELDLERFVHGPNWAERLVQEVEEPLEE